MHKYEKRNENEKTVAKVAKKPVPNPNNFRIFAFSFQKRK